MVRQAYRGGTIFYDVSRGYIHLEKQAGFAAPETLEAKTRFEREAQSVRITIKEYQADNGVFKSKEFFNEIAEKIKG